MCTKNRLMANTDKHPGFWTKDEGRILMKVKDLVLRYEKDEIKKVRFLKDIKMLLWEW